MNKKEVQFEMVLLLHEDNGYPEYCIVPVEYWGGDPAEVIQNVTATIEVEHNLADNINVSMLARDLPTIKQIAALAGETP